MPTPADIAAYLHYGYVPRVERNHHELPWARVRAADVARTTSASRAELVARGVAAFRAACADTQGALHVVPLSGGIDSRLILGTLLEAGLKDRLVAVTFGIPGTFDFDLAPRVARAAGVRHEVVNLAGLAMTRAELLEAARAGPWAHVFEVFYNRLVFRRFGTDAAYWSGNQANSLAGEDVGAVHADWACACREFAAETRLSRALDLDPPGFRAETALPAQPLLEDSGLNFVEQLFMLVRNPSRNDPGQLPAGFDVRTPFRRPEWVDFILRLPPDVRSGGLLYREIAARASPLLFALPLKNMHGFPLASPAWRIQLRRVRLKAARLLAARFPARLKLVDPKLNYVDLDEELRRPTPLRARIEECLQNLTALGRVDWLAPLELWAEHQERRANLGEALLLLASLELNLATGLEPEPAPSAEAAAC